MNRVERRARAKRVEKYLQTSWFIQNGVKLARKAGRTVDIGALAQPFTQDKLSKHNHRIKKAPELTEDDIEAEVVSMLLSKPGDTYHPVINQFNKKWPQLLGLREDKGYYWNLWAATKSVVKATWKRQPLDEMLTYLFSNDIARRYGLNKGRQRSHKNDVPAFVNREVNTVFDTDLTTTTDIDQIETQDLYQRTLAIVQNMELADQLVIRANQAATFEAGYRSLASELANVGITTPRGAKKRLASLPKRYPELVEIKKAL